ncbi:protein screw [Eupeodes corollae]|uniref:protein screw n=1 Tax=Eupeodes corollae TaxID=290404 RepID=UPI0024900B80|nr:protein screw [Eupeodes corollae]
MDNPYFLDENLEQSVVMKSLDSSEDEFQFEMADLLGLNERPKRIRNPISLEKSASKFLIELYNSIREEEEETHVSNHHKRVARSAFVNKEDRSVIENCNNIITFSSKKSKSNRKLNRSQMAATFNTNNVPEDLQLVRAELRIFQNSKLALRKFQYERNLTISVYHRVLHRKLQKIELRLLNSFTTTTNYNGWLEANVTRTVSKWLLRGYTPNGHELIISSQLTGISNNVLAENDNNLSPKDIGLIDQSGSEENQPFIIGYFNGPELLNKIQHLRVKRDIGRKKTFSSSDYSDYTEGESYKIPKNCERMNFSIDFKDLQMQDWVIAPKKFEAYFCGGDCNFPLGSKMNATNHAIVQTLMHLKQPNLPKPCCVPTVLGSISILHYLNEDSVNLSKYPNSVAKSCGCL